ncbi:hypothetical protein Y032_0085g1821 [Ancylostoma ceylanicum]|uniref:Uncharacterized protein n=1 Tax=Ancylostoma ceylanicum TaxID=53326 RepID=A0A016TQW7_9BILA|nr:hypothetical protein Y032_0085g1821 [Ancylostoma ceylanicum]
MRKQRETHRKTGNTVSRFAVGFTHCFPYVQSADEFSVEGVNTARRVRDDCSIFSAGKPLLFVFISHLGFAESVLHHPHISSESRISAGAAFEKIKYYGKIGIY